MIGVGAEVFAFPCLPVGHTAGPKIELSLTELSYLPRIGKIGNSRYLLRMGGGLMVLGSI